MRGSIAASDGHGHQETKISPTIPWISDCCSSLVKPQIFSQVQLTVRPLQLSLAQDFSEELYLNVTIADIWTPAPLNHTLLKIIVNTTAGYFELPNYMNDGVAGPLLDQDPRNLCGHDCEPQGHKYQPNVL